MGQEMVWFILYCASLETVTQGVARSPDSVYYYKVIETNQLQMTFIEGLLASGYVFDDEDYDGCYVKQDEDGLIHLYQEGEDEGEWNYVKMNDEFDVLTEKTFTV